MCAGPGVNYGVAVISLQRWRLTRDDWRTHRRGDIELHGDIEPHGVTDRRQALSATT